MSLFWSMYATIFIISFVSGTIISSVSSFRSDWYDRGMFLVGVALLMTLLFAAFAGLNALWGWHLIPWFNF